MFRPWKFLAMPLLVMAVAAAALAQHAQKDSATVSGQYEREFVPRAEKSPASRNRLFFPSISSKTAKSKAIAGGTLTTVFEPVQVSLLDAAGVSWPQWGHDPSHSGSINVVGQSPNQVIADIVYDPFVEQEKASGEAVFGEADLFVHYQTPLVDGNDVFMEFKSGTYTDLTTWETQTWNQRRLSWQNGQLVSVWNFQSDWKPVPFGGPVWEPVYHGVLVGNFFYDPGFGGTVYKLNRADGSVVTRYNPFGNSVDARTYVAGPLTADAAGNVYYNAIKLNNNAWGKDVVGAWLVKIAADGTISKVAFSTLVPNAPAANAPCKVQFDNSLLPWPPSPDAAPPTTPCGSQRPGINVAPAVAPDGTIYTISRTHFATRYGYLVAVNSDLTPKWTASLRDRLNDGCGVPVSSGGQLPPNGAPGGCRAGAHLGVDPGTNESGPGRVLDDGTSSPVVASDGSIFYGAYTRYNYAQGHMLHFDANGNFLNSFSFGWDITPAIYSHGGTYSVITKNNHYGEVGSYCDVETVCPSDRTVANSNGYPEAYFVSSLTPGLTLEWSYQNTNTLSCTRQPDGSVTCQSDHPNGFEWCVNAPAIDSHGVVYANSEDGNMFAINPDGTLKKKIFQQLAIGAAYTPASLGADGKIYSQNDGHLYVVGSSNSQASVGAGKAKVEAGKK